MKLSIAIKRFCVILLAILATTTFTADLSAADASKRKASTTQTSKRSKKSTKTKKRSAKSGRSKSKSKKTKKKSSRSKHSSKSRKTSRSRKSRTSRWTNHKETPAEVASSDSLTLLVNAEVLKSVPANLNPGGLRVNLVKPDHSSKTLQVRLNDNFTYLPVTNEFIKSLQHTVQESLPDSLSTYHPSLTVGDRSLSYYIRHIDKLPVQYRKNIPFVREMSPDVSASKGMPGDILAMWHSHGRYFKHGAWQWQRPLLFETLEDLYTMGYILPYIVPMIENAGAYVMLPRERDINRHEVIVDNDLNPDGQIFSQPYYREIQGQKQWENGEFDGFIYDLPDFRDTENPFEVGTYRQTQTIRNGTPSVAAWYADIPEDGEYAVYVSYKSLPNSTTDALYTVNYSGGSKDFLVNQKMGGSTWIYLGTFPLEKGYSDVEPVVTLSNKSQAAADMVVTADAVKIGGGMGNIARSPQRADIYYDPSTPETGDPAVDTSEDSEDDDDSDDDENEEAIPDDEGEASIDPEQPNPVEKSAGELSKSAQVKKSGAAPTFRTSGMPRFLEGARYWLHWAGVPEEVYSPYHGRDDYKDDYTGRALWVNYLAGGSRVLPDEPGLNIPIDAVMALHSDAGKRSDDSTVGTLGIYYTQGGRNYEDGTPRINSRMLTDYLMRQITSDIRQTYEPSWTRRSMWDKSYVEARVPEVPTSLIELLSHQNFGDMQYGLDPNFRFTVSRAVYKAMARFMAERKDRELVIQPLPVHDFAIRRIGARHYRLQWKATPDPLEKTAMPKEYIIMERREGDLGFHVLATTKSNHFEVKVKDTEVHSFKVIAVNKGGKSFPSETLAFREAPNNSKPVLIINGFTRVSAPGIINENGRVGFDSEQDFGVPYIRDISFAGHQREFRRGTSNLGASDGGYVTTVIAGNTFDYPSLHGDAIADAGYGFVSASAGAVENGTVLLKDYAVVDYILGKQKEGKVGNGNSGWHYKTFTPVMQKLLRQFVNKGGDLFVSGQYVASDLYSTRSNEDDKDFATRILGIAPGEKQQIRNARILVSDNELNTGLRKRTYLYNNTLNDKTYIVESPDMLEPMGEAEILMEFDDNSYGAAVARKSGKSHVVVMSIPFESITGEKDRSQLMKEILTYFNK